MAVSSPVQDGGQMQHAALAALRAGGMDAPVPDHRAVGAQVGIEQSEVAHQNLGNSAFILPP